MSNRKEIFEAEHYLSLQEGYPERPVSWFKETMLNRITHLLKGKKNLLDVGCASGYYTKEFEGVVANVTGIDYAANRIEYAQKTFQNNTVQFYCSSAEDFNDGKMYDCMFTSMVFQHMPLDVKIRSFENISKCATSDCLFLMYDFNSHKEDIGNDWVDPVSPQWLAKHIRGWVVKECVPFCNEYMTPNSTIWEYQLFKNNL